MWFVCICVEQKLYTLNSTSWMQESALATAEKPTKKGYDNVDWKLMTQPCLVKPYIPYIFACSSGCSAEDSSLC